MKKTLLLFTMVAFLGACTTSKSNTEEAAEDAVETVEETADEAMDSMEESTDEMMDEMESEIDSVAADAEEMTEE